MMNLKNIDHNIQSKLTNCSSPDFNQSKIPLANTKFTNKERETLIKDQEINTSDTTHKNEGLIDNFKTISKKFLISTLEFCTNPVKKILEFGTDLVKSISNKIINLYERATLNSEDSSTLTKITKEIQKFFEKESTRNDIKDIIIQATKANNILELEKLIGKYPEIKDDITIQILVAKLAKELKMQGAFFQAKMMKELFQLPDNLTEFHTTKNR